MRSINKRKGFTLIELLVVIVIIGILATLSVIALNSARAKARDAKRVSDVKQMQTALELFYSDKEAYPTASSAITLGEGTSCGGAVCDVLCDTTAGFQNGTTGCSTNNVYIPSIPADAGSSSYTYTSADGTTYSIAFSLESGSGSLSAGAHTAAPSGLQ